MHKTLGLLGAFLCFAAAATEIPIAKESWRPSVNNPKAILENTLVELNGRETRALRVTTKLVGGATYAFPKMLDASQFKSIRFQFRLESFNIYRGFGYLNSLAGGKKAQRCEINLNKCLGIDDGPILKDNWYNGAISLEAQDSFAPEFMQSFTIGMANWRPEDLPKDAVVSFIIANVRISKESSDCALDATQDIIAKRKEWQDFLNNFKVDYSDGAHLMQPPQGNRFKKPLPLVQDGKPMAEIHVNTGYAMPAALTAADELQYHVKLITGVELPINKPLRKPGVTKIFIGKSARKILYNERLFRTELQELAGSDGFAIRQGGEDELYIFGESDKGALNGVYTLLENNTDIIWVRPNPDFGTVFSKRSDLSLVWGNGVIDKPDTPCRGFSSFGTQQYIAHNRGNDMTGGGGDNYWAFASAKKYGPYDFWYHGGHNICTFVTNSHPFEKYPELYALINGARRGPGSNLCFTNPKIKDIFSANVIDTLRRIAPDVAGIHLSLDDTWLWCECDACQAPITLEDDSKLTRIDPAFQSTRMFLFLNQIAEDMVKAYPKYTMKALAYFQTAEPPKCAVHPAIIPQFAPYVRVNDKNPIYSPENIIWLDRLMRWREKCNKVAIYGYNSLGLAFPRPLCHVHKRDFREIHKYAIGISAEGTSMQWGDNPASKKSQSFMWDMSAIEFWVMFKLYWNPEQDVETLYKQFNYRAFQEAAKPMERFYGALREEWFKSKSASTIGDNPISLASNFIIRTGREKELRGYLAEAAKLVKNPNSKILVQRLSERFEAFVKEAHGIKTPSATIPLIRVEGEAGFDSTCWQGAAIINEFQMLTDTSKPSAHKTEVAIFHDSQKLYFRMKIFENDMKDIQLFANPEGKEHIGEAAHIEIFLEDATAPGDYYMFSIDAGGNHADLKKYDMKWNSTWKHNHKSSPHFWEAIAIIPLDAINVDMAKTNTVRGTIIREVHNANKTINEYSSWMGGKHHQPQTFGAFTLMK